MAASVDRASRSDVADFRSQTTRQESAATRPAAPGFLAESNEFTIHFTPGISAAVASNPGQASTNVISGSFYTPSFDLEIDRPNLVPHWNLEAHLVVDGDYFFTHASDFNEGRLDGSAALSKKSKAGTLTVAFETKSSFAGDFTNPSYTQERYSVGFAPAFGATLNLNVRAEYRSSDNPDQRRSLVQIKGGGTLLKTTNYLTLTWQQAFLLSSFRAGTNDGRKDLLSSSKLSLGKTISQSAQLSLDVYLFHNFSNRGDHRFTDVEIGPTLTQQF